MARPKRSTPLDHRISQLELEVSAEIHETSVSTGGAEIEKSGLTLSPIKMVETASLEPLPFNSQFERFKTDKYFDDLKRDIIEAGLIIEPLIVTNSNQILSGHSRHRIASELFAGGDSRFEYVPVRYVENDLTEAEIERRVILLNINRFEIDPDSRLYFRAKVYPDYYQPSELPRSRKTSDTVNTAAKIAQESNLSERQVKNERKVYQEAKKTFHSDDDGDPTPDEIKAARDGINESRRARTNKSTGSINAKPRRAHTTEKPSDVSGSHGVDLADFDSACIPAERIIGQLTRYCGSLKNNDQIATVVGFVRLVAKDGSGKPQ